MKKTIMLILFLAFIAMNASADAVLVNGVYYELVGTTARVTKNPNYYDGTVWIPPYIEYGGYKFEVTSIHDRAFSSCTHMTEITIPSTIKTIGKYSFNHCTALKAVHISDLDAWLNIDYSLEGDFRENRPLYYAQHLFLNGKEITSLTIPNNLTCLKDFLFCGWSGLTSVTIPNNVTSIGVAAFYGCSGLTSITIPNSVTSIGAGAFQNCSGLTSITIPNSVTYIGAGTFYKCTNLTSVIIGNGIKELNDETFGYCFYVKDIYCYAEIPPILGSNNFTTSAKLHVPAKSIDLYKNAYRWESWDHFGKIVALTDSDPKPTGIINIKTDAQNEEMYYDLLGRRVSEPSKGLYIINGKKVLMK